MKEVDELISEVRKSDTAKDVLNAIDKGEVVKDELIDYGDWLIIVCKVISDDPNIKYRNGKFFIEDNGDIKEFEVGYDIDKESIDAEVSNKVLSVKADKLKRGEDNGVYGQGKEPDQKGEEGKGSREEEE